MASIKEYDISPQQKLFADYYMACWSGVEAARLAGYSGNDNVLGVTAHRLLKNAKIIRYIEDMLSIHVMSANEVLMRLSNIARGTFEDYLDESGLLDMTKARRAKKLHLVSRLKDRHFVDSKNDTETHEVELELYSALEALKTLAKYHDLITSKTLKIEDWRSLAVEHIKAGRIAYEALAQEFDESLADELFKQAGVPIT
jgi:phage terminase small subunit